MLSIRIDRRTVDCLFLALTIPAFVVSGCSLPHFGAHDHDHSHGGHGDDHGHGQDPDHGHDDESESLTLWTERLELFAEFPFLETGAPQEFLLHLTHLQSGLPVLDATIAYRATSRDSAHTIEGREKGARPGIYSIAPVFPVGGDWDVELEVLMDAESDIVVMSGLDVHEEDDDHHHHEEVEPVGPIAFTKEQQWVVPVITTPVVKGDLVERHRVPATVLETPETRSIAAAPLSGMLVTPEPDTFPRIGDRVERGTMLAAIAPTSLGGDSLARASNVQGLRGLRAELTLQATRAAGEASSARALVEQHATALDRAERLLAARAGARRDVDELRGVLAGARATLTAAEQAKAEARQALAELTPAESEENSRDTVPVLAPITGHITRVFAGQGKHVETGQPVFDVVNTEQVLIEGLVPELLAPILTRPPSGLFEIPGLPGLLHDIHTPGGAPRPWLLPEVSDGTRTVPALFHADNPDGLLRIGMTLVLWLEGRRAGQTLHVPRSAILDENGINTAYVMLSGETFQKRPVRLGISDGVRVEVLDGLQEGDRVVSQGAYAVRLAGTVADSFGSAHVH